MTKYKRQGFRNTFRNARKGMRLSLKSERNLRVHFLAAALTIVTGFCLKFSVVRFSILLLTIGSVISAEMFNSAIEFALDALYHNKYSRLVGIAKDISAGAVMVVTIIAVMIGVLLFIPPVITVLSKI